MVGSVPISSKAARPSNPPLGLVSAVLVVDQVTITFDDTVPTQFATAGWFQISSSPPGQLSNPLASTTGTNQLTFSLTGTGSLVGPTPTVTYVGPTGGLVSTSGKVLTNGATVPLS